MIDGDGAVAQGFFPQTWVAVVCRGGPLVYEEAHDTRASHPRVAVQGEPVTGRTVYDLAFPDRGLGARPRFVARRGHEPPSCYP